MKGLRTMTSKENEGALEGKRRGGAEVKKKHGRKGRRRIRPSSSVAVGGGGITCAMLNLSRSRRHSRQFSGVMRPKNSRRNSVLIM